MRLCRVFRSKSRWIANPREENDGREDVRSNREKVFRGDVGSLGM